MSVLRIAILEDEAPARRLLVRLLAELAPAARVVAELESVADARVERTLAELERDLEGAEFFRVSRGYLVHATAIASFRAGGRGRIDLTLSPAAPDEVLVSQENAAAFRRFLDR